MKKMKIIMDKFPHLKNVKETISSIQQEIELLNERKRLSAAYKENVSSNYETNELELVLLRTDREISKLFKTLNDQEKHFKNYKEKLSSLLDEVSENFDSYIKEQRKLIMTSDDVRFCFEQFKPFDFNENWEAKIQFYSNLQSIEKAAAEKTK
jgi:hypothetical protein